MSSLSTTSVGAAGSFPQAFARLPLLGDHLDPGDGALEGLGLLDADAHARDQRMLQAGGGQALNIGLDQVDVALGGDPPSVRREQFVVEGVGEARDGMGAKGRLDLHPQRLAPSALVGVEADLVGAVLYLVSAIKMTNELKAVTGNAGFAWWPMFIPVYSIYWMWILVPQEIAKAKQMRGVQSGPRGIIVYIFFFLYAFAADLNDIAKAP